MIVQSKYGKKESNYATGYDLQSNIYLMYKQDQNMESQSSGQADDGSINLYGIPDQLQMVRQNGHNFGLKNADQKSADFKQDFRETSDVDDRELPCDNFVLKFYSDDFSEQNMFNIEPNPQNNTSQNMVMELAQMSIKKKEKKQTKKQSRKGSKSEKSRKKGRKIKKCKSESETKNIPKNYGKQIIKFIKKQKKTVQKCLNQIGSKVTHEKLVQDLKSRKKHLNKITDLKRLWIQYEYSKEFRVLSNYFLRKKCFSWIFNSRIQKVTFPIKYRYKIIEGVQNPKAFEHLKDF